MEIGRIVSTIPQTLSEFGKRVEPEAEAPKTAFADVLTNALGNTVDTDHTDKNTNIGLLIGELEDIHTATIAAEQAKIVLDLTMSIRNRVLEAYQEIMRMQM